MPPSVRRGKRTARITAYIEPEYDAFIETFRQQKGLPTSSSALNTIIALYQQKAEGSQGMEEMMREVLQRQTGIEQRQNVLEQKISMFLILMYKSQNQDLSPTALEELSRILTMGGPQPSANPT